MTAGRMFARAASLTLRYTSASVTTNSLASRLAWPNSACVHRFHTSPRNMAADSAAVKFSAGSDETAMNASLEKLLSSAGNGGRWTLIPNGQGIERSFKFKTFAKTWDFMTAVSLQCKLKNHHPEWSNVYNTTYIRWTTHNPEGLSSKDTELALLCDALARDFGEVVEEADSCPLRQVADRVVVDAGDCCTPKKK